MAGSGSSRAADPLHTFCDGLGSRTVIAEKGGIVLELLRVTPDFALVPRFDATLRERVSRLANFRHPSFARVRRVDRLDGAGGLGIVSEHATGLRLSHVIELAERHELALDINAALCLLRQLVPAVARLHHDARDVAHGALAPERIVVTPTARVVVTDHVLGSALEQLRLSRERLWRDLHVAVPPGAGHPRLDQRADVMQLGVVALTLVLGRALLSGDLRALPELVGGATERTLGGAPVPLSLPLRRWLLRALQADPRGSYASAAEAEGELEEVVTGEGGYVAAPVALEAFIARCRELALQPDEAPAPPPSLEEPHGEESTAPARSASDPWPAGHAAGDEEAAGRDHPTPRQIPEPGEGLETVVESSQAEPPSEAGAEPATEASTAGDVAAYPGDDAPEHERRAPRWVRIALVASAVVVLVEAGVIWWLADRAGVLASTRATMNVESRPAGLKVLVDGELRGETPLALTLRPGARVVELRGEQESRVLPMRIEGGRAYTHYVEMPSSVVTGAIEIRGYAGARVLVDGQLRGVAPLKIVDLAPGSHEVVVDTRGGQVRQAVEVRAGLTTPFDTGARARAASGAGAPVAAAHASHGKGLVRVSAPYEMQVFTAGRPLGVTGGDAFELPTGRHRLEIVSTTLGFRTARDVDVAGGREAHVAIELPRGTLTLESTPPAEVWVSGTRLGETPIYDAPVAIGPHTVTFRHPELGEQHHPIVVTANAPARVKATFQR
jgi:hypothetical protein